MRAHEFIDETTRRGFLGGMAAGLAAGAAGIMGTRSQQDSATVAPSSTQPSATTPITQKPVEKEPEKKGPPKKELVLFNPRQNYPTLVNTALKSGITQILDLANLLGNCEVETLSWTSPVESFIYSDPQRLYRHFTSVFKTPEDAEPYSNKKDIESQMALANKVYANKLGNTEPDDGWRFRGRGFIHLTGRENYAKAGKAIHGDPNYYINNPDILSTNPLESALAAVWYFKNKVGFNVVDPKLAARRVNQSSKIDERVEAINKFKKHILPRTEAVMRLQKAQAKASAAQKKKK